MKKLIDSSITRSIASLVKNNGGKFKSEKQARFINSKFKNAEDVTSAFYDRYANEATIGVFISEPNVFRGQTYKQVYMMDNEGVQVHFSAKSVERSTDYSERLVDAQQDMKGGGFSQEEYDELVKEVAEMEAASRRTIWEHSVKFER